MFNVKIEKVLKWNQREVPLPQTPVYFYLGGWSESLPGDGVKREGTGIYLGEEWVLSANRKSQEYS